MGVRGTAVAVTVGVSGTIVGTGVRVGVRIVVAVVVAVGSITIIGYVGTGVDAGTDFACPGS